MRKIVIGIVAALAGLMVLAAVVPYLIPTSTSRSWVEERLARHLDARITIESFRLQLLPYPGYSIRGFGLISTKPPFQGMPIVWAEKVRGSLSPLALLSGKIITSITARGVTFDYRLATGTSNMGMMFGWSAPRPDEEIPKAQRGPQAVPAMARPIPTPSAPTPTAAPRTIEPIPSPEGSPEIRALPATQLPAKETNVAPSIRAVPPKADERAPTTAPRTAPASGGAPTSGIPEFIVRAAVAAPLTVGGEGEQEVIVRSVEVVRGRLNIFRELGVKPFTIEGIELIAGNLQVGPQLTANLRMTGRLPGSQRPDLSVEGQVVVDRVRRELGTRGLKLYLAGSQFVADASVNYVTHPAAFDIHAATPALVPQTAAQFAALLGRGLPWGLAWQGAMAADLVLRGTRDVFELGLQLDATTAGISAGDAFFKGAGLPFKVASQISVGPNAFLVREANFVLGDDAIRVTGEVRRDPASNVRLSIKGDDLDAATLKVFLPRLSAFDVVDELAIDLSIDGALGGEPPLVVSGRFGAQGLGFAGVTLADVSGSFALTNEGVAFPTIKASFAGGALAGNGKVTFGQTTDYVFDVVIDHLEAASIPSLKGALVGEASLVAKATSSGIDPVTLESNLTLEGSLILAKGSLPSLKLEGVFGRSTWEIVGERSQVTIEEEAVKKLLQADDAVEKLDATFTFSETGLKVPEFTWQSPDYAVKLAIESDALGRMQGDGQVFVSRGVTTELIESADLRKVLVDNKGRLPLPVTVGGELVAPVLDIDRVELTDLVEAKLKPPEPIGPPAKVIRAEEPKVAPRKTVTDQTAPEKASEATAAKPTTPAPAAKPAAKKRPSKRRVGKPRRRQQPAPSQPPMQDIEDILKVIIGQ